MARQIKSIIVIVLVVVAIASFFLAAKYLGSGESVESDKPAVICKAQNAPEPKECFWTAHIHATVKVFKSGKQIPIQFEQGKLEEEHTHSEQNKIHWHGLIPLAPNAKEVKDWSPLAVSTIPNDLKLSFEGTPKFIVNGQEVSLSYIWQDGDIIEIRYE